MPATKRDITAPWRRSLVPPTAGRIEVLDARQDNSVLRLAAGGAVSWSVRARRRAGKQVRVTLGRWPETGIAEARTRARAIRADVWRGADPTAEKRAAAAERKARRLASDARSFGPNQGARQPEHKLRTSIWIGVGMSGVAAGILAERRAADGRGRATARNPKASSSVALRNQCSLSVCLPDELLKHHTRHDNARTGHEPWRPRRRCEGPVRRPMGYPPRPLSGWPV